jgi:hypothetical protein
VLAKKNGVFLKGIFRSSYMWWLLVAVARQSETNGCEDNVNPSF